MTKTLLALFSLPLIAQSGLNINIPTIPPSITERFAGPEIEKEQLAAALDSLSASAEIGYRTAGLMPAHTQTVLERDQQDDELNMLLGNINQMLEQAE